jgi:rare lipoprotein A (peptidoglycan hydrolase)
MAGANNWVGSDRDSRRSVRVRVNDYGPYVVVGALDPSLRAAQKIGIARQGVARLRELPTKVARRRPLHPMTIDTLIR